MTFYSVKDYLTGIDDQFNSLNQDSVLGHFVNQIVMQINEADQQKFTNDLSYDIINQSGDELDYIAQPLGMSRNIYSQFNSQMLMDNCVMFRSKDSHKSLLQILQSIYNTSDNFPDVVYVKYKDMILKVFTDYTKLNGLDTTQQIYSQQIEQYSLTNINSGETLEFTYGFEQLGEHIIVKSIRYISDFFGYEPDEQFKARIQQRLQNNPEPTLNYIDSAIRSKLSNIRYLYTKQFQRGLSTIDMIIFPPISSLYDDNNNLKITQDLAPLVQRDIDDMQPLGIDILAVDAQQVPLSLVVTQQDSTNKDAIQEIVKQSVIQSFNITNVAIEYTIDKLQLINDANTQLANNGIIQKVTDIELNLNGEQFNRTIKDTEYPVLNSIEFIWS